ncbi:hypothetical protein [Clostridioides sp. GD02404]|nr:hypothetical protein [Clostridioides difficile]
MSEKYYGKMKGYLIFIDIVTLIGEGKEQISRRTNGIKTILYAFTM